jgi:predicted  nucleic acid-binding Zn-ribbon protein
VQTDQLQTQIKSTASRIHTLQQTLKELTQQSGKANYQASRMRDDSRRHQAGGRSVDLRSELAAVEEAERNAEEKRAAVSRLEEQITDAHDELTAYHLRRRLALILNGRELPTLLLRDPRNGDAALTALDRTAGELLAKCDDARAKLADITIQLDETTGRLSVARADVHRGLVTKPQLAALARDHAAMSAAAAALDRETRDIGAAYDTVQAERTARVEKLAAETVPALRAEEKRRLQVFADALRDAAVAAVSAWQVTTALHTVGVTPAAYVLNELRLDLCMPQQSVVGAWLLEAIEKGLIT